MNSMQAPPRSPNHQKPQPGPPRVAERLSYGWRQARRIFHLLIGLTFFFFAAAGATLSYSEWQEYSATPANGIWRFAMLSSFTVLLVIFGVYSIAKVRSVR
ncbi:MAG TPA: hypothetical protein VG860_11360 [Terriglobia bacterium]|nr:hypothetical protein [Terriglobia bacterium]